MKIATAPTHIFETPEDLAREAADWIVERACEERRRLAICLSGGSTPKRLYELLAAPVRCARFPWDRTHWFWGDERMVPHDDPQSNFHMVRQALLQHVPAPPENIHAIPTEHMSPAAGAAAYETALKHFYSSDTLEVSRPLFDLTLLGLGEDGHIASLFPESPALAETKRWAVPVVGKNSLDRITLTYPTLETSRFTTFIVAGENKRKILSRVRDGDPSLPATRLRPTGSVYWFVDRAAAAAPALAGK